ncbi:MAG: endonuclease domain-containing protein [Phenylobacterium sp.]|uniref:endonuclease domain-containing protein n=1 Tax=Phenylobacterium sp. TaxID=1871053 RepID=UPI001A5FD80C|nr:endonuclease domain-containing protein [Phenylobacterium sp.]MBL8770764.1 endonuclease domain-containing protein [Phenylobacterium sp.]
MDAARPVRDRAWVYRRALSLPEVILWKALKGRRAGGLHFRRQHPLGPYVLDFYCDALKLDVEVDGQGHGFGDRPARDARRDAWLRSRGVRTLRLSAATVLRDVDDAVRTILAAAAATSSPSSLRDAGPPPEGEDPTV